MPREPREAKAARAAEIVARLRRAYPKARISLRYANRFQLLVAVVLSAQCTDEMVNRVTPSLFRKYRTVEDFARADARVLAKEIHATGYHNQKARHVTAAARLVRDRFGGKLPSTMVDLLLLPGVGRKTANVLLWNGFGKLEGVAVDTHVTRLSRLLGLTRRRDAARIERDLVDLVPREAWGEVTHVMIEHGRAVCVARRPRCERCVLNDLCPSALRPPERPPQHAWMPRAGPRTHVPKRDP